MILKNLGEVTVVVEAAVEGYFREGGVRANEPFAGVVDSYFIDKLEWRHVEELFEVSFKLTDG